MLEKVTLIFSALAQLRPAHNGAMIELNSAVQDFFLVKVYVPTNINTSFLYIYIHFF